MTMTSELAAAGSFLLSRLPAGSRVLCAVSGGLDSMCLLHFMNTWGREQGFGLMAAHFNHRLRETAGRDEAFVRRYCGEADIPCFSGSGDVRELAEREGLSPEEAARKLRYAFLEETAEREGCAAILTAHHAGDQAETVLLNLIRGTGLRGLTGIPARRGSILRPFLEIPRTELAEYAAAHDIPHVEDETNADPDAAARNLLRLKVLPLLRELNPRAVEHIAAAAEQLREIDAFLEEEARLRIAGAEVREGRVALAVTAEAWERIPTAVRPRMLLRLLELLGAGRKDIGAVHVEALERLISGGGQLDLPRGVTARYGDGQLVLETAPRPLKEIALQPGRPLRWGDYTLTLLDRREGEGLALRRGDGTVTVAPCAAGDRLTLPETHGGARTVKRLCRDRRISAAERETLPAVYVEDRLAAVWRLGVDTEFLPAGDACRFIQITKCTEERQYEK